MDNNTSINPHLLTHKIITEPFKNTGLNENTMNNSRSTPNITDQLAVTDCAFLMINEVKSRIDCLHIQFKPKNEIEFKYVSKVLIDWLNEVGIKSINTEPNLKYFDHGCLLKANDQTNSACGAIKWNQDYDVIRVELSGKGCSYINTNDTYFSVMKELEQTTETFIKRIDIAVDTYEKKHGLRFVQQSFSKGLYAPKTGASPLRENHSSPTGQSIYIGSRHSYKQIIGYEKGKQLKFPKDSKEYSNWFRHEVRLKGRKGHCIPIDALFNPDSYFVGAYPKANQRILKSATPRVIKREVIKLVDKSLRKGLAYANHQVGKTIHCAVKRGLEDKVIIQTIMRPGKKDNLCYPSFVSKADKENYMFE
jgi:DNA relaxase NicK